MTEIIILVVLENTGQSTVICMYYIDDWLGIDEGCHGSHPQSCSASSHMADSGGSSALRSEVVMRLLCRKSDRGPLWVGFLEIESHVKDSCSIFQDRLDALYRYRRHFCPYPTSIFCQWPSFLLEFMLNLFSH